MRDSEHTFPEPPTKTWKMGAGFSAIRLMRGLAIGESLRLLRRQSIHASATVGRYRQEYAASDPYSQWTTRSTFGPGRRTRHNAMYVDIMRLPYLDAETLAQRKAAALIRGEELRRRKEDRGGAPLRPERAGEYAEALQLMELPPKASTVLPDDGSDMFD